MANIAICVFVFVSTNGVFWYECCLNHFVSSFLFFDGKYCQPLFPKVSSCNIVPETRLRYFPIFLLARDVSILPTNESSKEVEQMSTVWILRLKNAHFQTICFVNRPGHTIFSIYSIYYCTYWKHTSLKMN